MYVGGNLNWFYIVFPKIQTSPFNFNNLFWENLVKFTPSILPYCIYSYRYERTIASFLPFFKKFVAKSFLFDKSNKHVIEIFSS